MTVNDFLNVFADASINIQLIHNDTQVILANGSKLRKADLRKYMEAEVKSIRLDSWMSDGTRQNEIELGISM